MALLLFSLGFFSFSKGEHKVRLTFYLRSVYIIHEQTFLVRIEKSLPKKSTRKRNCLPLWEIHMCLILYLPPNFRFIEAAKFGSINIFYEVI